MNSVVPAIADLKASCDPQHLFAEDIPGENRGHVPRHAKICGNFTAEYDRLQHERIAVFSEFKNDMETVAFPNKDHLVAMGRREHKAFMGRTD